MTQKTLLEIALETPPVNWNQLADAWTRQQPTEIPIVFGAQPVISRGSIQDAERQLDSCIERLARFREYISQRNGSGCGDQGHAAAVEASNKLAGKIRKALGYTQALNDYRF